MRNHPATKPRVDQNYGQILLLAIESGIDAIVNLPNVYNRGTRVLRTPAGKRSPARSYYLDAFEFRDIGQREFFYVISGGKSNASTVLDSNGNAVARGEQVPRVFSPMFREFIDNAIASDTRIDDCKLEAAAAQLPQGIGDRAQRRTVVEHARKLKLEVITELLSDFWKNGKDYDRLHKAYAEYGITREDLDAYEVEQEGLAESRDSAARDD